MQRTDQQWINMSPEADCAGSPAQVLCCIRDARHDILELLCKVNALKTALGWCVENDGECLGDYAKRREAFASLI